MAVYLMNGQCFGNQRTASNVVYTDQYWYYVRANTDGTFSFYVTTTLSVQNNSSGSVTVAKESYSNAVATVYRGTSASGTPTVWNGGVASPKTNLTVSAHNTYGSSSQTTECVLSRTDAYQDFFARIVITSTGSSGVTFDLPIRIPPYKQNATNSNRRITYTSNGTKYDLLNWK